MWCPLWPEEQHLVWTVPGQIRGKWRKKCLDLGWTYRNSIQFQFPSYNGLSMGAFQRFWSKIMTRSFNNGRRKLPIICNKWEQVGEYQMQWAGEHGTISILAGCCCCDTRPQLILGGVTDRASKISNITGETSYTPPRFHIIHALLCNQLSAL